MNPEDAGFLTGILAKIYKLNAGDKLECELLQGIPKLSLTDFVAMAIVTNDGGLGIQILDAILLAELNDCDQVFTASEDRPDLIVRQYRRPVHKLLEIALQVVLPTESLVTNLLALWQMCRMETQGWDLMWASLERLKEFPQRLTCLTLETYIGLLEILINEEDSGELIKSELEKSISQYNLEFCAEHCKPPLWERSNRVEQWKNAEKVRDLKVELNRVRFARKLAEELELPRLSAISMDDLSKFWFAVLRQRVKVVALDDLSGDLENLTSEWCALKSFMKDGLKGFDAASFGGESWKTQSVIGLSDILIALLRARILIPNLTKDEIHERFVRVVTVLEQFECEDVARVMDELFFDEEIMNISESWWKFMSNRYDQAGNNSVMKKLGDKKTEMIRQTSPAACRDPDIVRKILLQSRRSAEIIENKFRAAQIISKFNDLQPHVIDAWDFATCSTTIAELIHTGLIRTVEHFVELPLFNSKNWASEKTLDEIFNHLPTFWRPAYSEREGRIFLEPNYESKSFFQEQLDQHVVKINEVKIDNVRERIKFDNPGNYVLDKLLNEELAGGAGAAAASSYLRVIWLLNMWIVFSEDFDKEVIAWKRQLLLLAQMMNWRQSKWSEFMRLYIKASDNLSDENPSLQMEIQVASLFDEHSKQTLTRWPLGYSSERRRLWACFGLIRYYSQSAEHMLEISELIYNSLERIQTITGEDRELLTTTLKDLFDEIKITSPRLLPSLSRLCTLLELEGIREIKLDHFLEDLILPSEEYLPSKTFVSTISEITSNMRLESYVLAKVGDSGERQQPDADRLGGMGSEDSFRKLCRQKIKSEHVEQKETLQTEIGVPDPAAAAAAAAAAEADDVFKEMASPPREIKRNLEGRRKK